MKKINVLVATVIVALGVSATSCDSKRSASLKTGVDSASYAIGIANGSMFKQNLDGMPGGPVNVDDLLAGFPEGQRLRPRQPPLPLHREELPHLLLLRAPAGHS